MYVPSHFAVDDRAQLVQFMARHSFATLLSWSPEPMVSHLPLVVRSEPELLLLTHLARANPHARMLAAGGQALVIFQGPHAYVSPTLYESEQMVPTWNYTAVHAWVQARPVEDVDALLETTIGEFEASYLPRWRSLPDDYRNKMRQGIVAVELRVERLEGKFKLSQNRSPADQQRVMASFAASDSAEQQALAAMMQSLKKTSD